MLTSFGYIVLAFIAVLVTVGYIFNSSAKKRWWSIPACLVVLVILFFAYRKADLAEVRQIEDFKSTAYDEGYEAGEDYGFEKGKDYGYDEGYNNGYDEGKSEGYNEGYREGHGEGFDEGNAAGYTSGYDNGYLDAEIDILG